MPMYRLNIHYKEEDLQMIARAHITIAAVKHTANDCLESRMEMGHMEHQPLMAGRNRGNKEIR